LNSEWSEWNKQLEKSAYALLLIKETWKQDELSARNKHSNRGKLKLILINQSRSINIVNVTKRVNLKYLRQLILIVKTN